MFKIAYWYNNYQSPSVLMIDDLSDAYIDVYDISYKNDWGYLCDSTGSAYSFLKKNLLNKFTSIKITFFVPYARHNVINPSTLHKYKKYAVGERQEFSNFLMKLNLKGHEISHHGSNHGKYLNINDLSTIDNFQHEWKFFSTVQKGIETTLKGNFIFKKECNIGILGGKFCGYIKIENSLEIIDKCNFNYWCHDIGIITKKYDCEVFGKNRVVSFPTSFSGNSFVRLSYKTGDKQRDNKKKIVKFLQPIYNIFQYKKLNKLYKNQSIISIQEHISPSTTSGNIQSANIVSDINSLNKIYQFLRKKSIWYATCAEISKYFYIRENTKIETIGNKIIITFNNYKKFKGTVITVTKNNFFQISDTVQDYSSTQVNMCYVVNLVINDGQNFFTIKKEIS